MVALFVGALVLMIFAEIANEFDFMLGAFFGFVFGFPLAFIIGAIVSAGGAHEGSVFLVGLWTLGISTVVGGILASTAVR